MTYTHLTEEERYKLYEHMRRGDSLTSIAFALGRHKSTVSRDLRRKKGFRGHRPTQAQVYAQRRAALPRGGRRIRPMTWAFCRRLIYSGHSPEQAAGRCVKETGERVSHDYLYRRFYANKANGGKLWRKLRCQKLRRKRYGSGKRLRGLIANRVGIERRCPRVESRSIIGHWEGDTIIGRNQRGVLVTLVERRSDFRLPRKVFSKGAGEVAAAITEMLISCRSLVPTLTFDNGLEYARHGEISMALDCKIYFACPYASWQRGSRENLNGLLRQYFPKRLSFARVTSDRVLAVQRQLNDPARKRLDWATPYEVFEASAKRLGVALAG